MANICSNTPIKDDVIKGLRAELNFIRKSICSLQGGGPGGTTIYTGDGSLSGDRIVDLNGHTLEFETGTGYWDVGSSGSFGFQNGDNNDVGYFSADASYLRGVNSVNDTKTVVIQVSSDEDRARGVIDANYNDVHQAFIQVDANSTESTTLYSADTHTLNGNVGIGVIPTYLFQVTSPLDDLLYVDAAGFSTQIGAYDGTARTKLQLNATFGDSVGFSLSADNGTNSVEISGDPINGIAFFGTLNLPTQSAPASPNDGDIWREDNTNTGLKIRVNGITKTITLS